MMIYIIGELIKMNILRKEIDLFMFRLKKVELKITRPPLAIGRYQMILHTKRTPSAWKKR